MTPLMIICAVTVIIGLAFMLASLIGIAVLPDFFTRLHAQGVGDTIGAFFVLAGMAAAAWGGILPVKIFLIFLVILLTNPIGTNLMMIAAINKEDYMGYRSGIADEVPGEPEEPEPEPEPETESVVASEEFNEQNNSETAPQKKKRKPRKRKPSMSMNKAELIKAAKSRGITVPEQATKREILDLIYGGSSDSGNDKHNTGKNNRTKEQ